MKVEGGKNRRKKIPRKMTRKSITQEGGGEEKGVRLVK